MHRAAGLLGQAEDLARQRRQAPAARSERDAAPLADEELVAQLPAQGADRDRHGGLGHLELGGGRLHRAQAGDEDEGLELGEGQRLKPRRFGGYAIP